MNYWVMKSEPDVYGIDDLARERIAGWEGVRNFQARNMLRDQMKEGDRAFFYHSNTEVPGIVGLMRIHREGHPDDTAFDPNSRYYDPKSDPEKPRWYMVDVAFEEKLDEPLSLGWLKKQPEMADCPLVKRGNRLSIVPLTAEEGRFLMKYAGKGRNQHPPRT